jgi:hypothetical protein
MRHIPVGNNIISFSHPRVIGGAVPLLLNSIKTTPHQVEYGNGIANTPVGIVSPAPSNPSTMRQTPHSISGGDLALNDTNLINKHLKAISFSKKPKRDNIKFVI